DLWGNFQKQKAPTFYFYIVELKKTEKVIKGQKIYETKEIKIRNNLTIEASDINVEINLKHRKKGLLWYSTYKVNFEGIYTVANETEVARETFIIFEFPNSKAIYDNFKFSIAGKEVENIEITGGKVVQKFLVAPRKTEIIIISYESQGLDEWWYNFGTNVSQIKNFNLKMKTDFKDIDFPQNSISPSNKEEISSGWNLDWTYTNLLSGVQIGMKMPQKLNPGPWVGKVTLWAWVSLFLFFFLIFIISIIKDIKIHPMHYMFIAPAYFSFHLLMAYLVDHISIHLAFAISAVISILLIFSYMRIIIGVKKAFSSILIAQLVYQVLFSYTFFFEKFTGLAITILCILTLFLVMQFTAKINWEEAFRNKPKPKTEDI
ncbi:inner membrane CreD family protein, partial [Candidatus Dependentiae bacterium]|nr:inner membrane CreD family protein [Candidatus Dependentiae bacterium]